MPCASATAAVSRAIDCISCAGRLAFEQLAVRHTQQSGQGVDGRVDHQLAPQQPGGVRHGIDLKAGRLQQLSQRRQAWVGAEGDNRLAHRAHPSRAEQRGAGSGHAQGHPLAAQNTRQLLELPKPFCRVSASPSARRQAASCWAARRVCQDFTSTSAKRDPEQSRTSLMAPHRIGLFLPIGLDHAHTVLLQSLQALHPGAQHGDRQAGGGQAGRKQARHGAGAQHQQLAQGYLPSWLNASSTACHSTSGISIECSSAGKSIFFYLLAVGG